MNIHTVQSKDTVFSIAREYGVSPLKLIETNGLSDPDRLCVGEELCIFHPTRTVTVRGGDELLAIARRFGVKKQALYKNNPGLGGTDRIYPGQELAIRYQAPPGGMCAANGYVYRGTTTERLQAVLPYICYLTVAGASVQGEEILLSADAKQYKALGKAAGKTVLLRIGGMTDKAFLEHPQLQSRWIEAMIQMAKAEGYDGITLSACTPARENPYAFGEFVLQAKKKMLGSDLILFTETDANASPLTTDPADGSILFYEKSHLKQPPTFAMGEKALLTDYAQNHESSKAFVELPCFGYDENEPLTRDEILKLCHKYKAEIKTDPDTLLSSFAYKRFFGGRGERRNVCFEQPSMTKAKLNLIEELGFMGVVLDVGRISIPTLMLFHTSFSEVEYLFRLSEEA